MRTVPVVMNREERVICEPYISVLDGYSSGATTTNGEHPIIQMHSIWFGKTFGAIRMLLYRPEPEITTRFETKMVRELIKNIDYGTC